MTTPKKRNPLAVCDGTSTTHGDFEMTWHHVISTGEERVVGERRLPYYVVPLPFDRIADAIFLDDKGQPHKNARPRLRAVFDHMLRAKKRDGSFCCDLIPFKGRSQGRERLFAMRDDSEALLLAFHAEDEFKHFDGLAQGIKRRSSEAVGDRSRWATLMTSATNSGDFEGYRLCKNAVEEIDHDGDVRASTQHALYAHFAGRAAA